MPPSHQTHYPQQRLTRQDRRRITRKRKGPKIAAQVIHHRSRAQSVRQLKEFNEGGFGPIFQARLVLSQGFERLLKAVEFERGEAFLDEDISEAEGEFLYYQIRISVLVSSTLRPAYLEKAVQWTSNCPGP